MTARPHKNQIWSVTTTDYCIQIESCDGETVCGFLLDGTAKSATFKRKDLVENVSDRPSEKPTSDCAVLGGPND